MLALCTALQPFTVRRSSNAIERDVRDSLIVSSKTFPPAPWCTELAAFPCLDSLTTERNYTQAQAQPPRLRLPDPPALQTNRADGFALRESASRTYHLRRSDSLRHEWVVTRWQCWPWDRDRGRMWSYWWQRIIEWSTRATRAGFR